MDDELYNDLMQSLNEALAYERGDITKGRSVIVSIPDEEIEANQAFFQQFSRLSEPNRRKVIQYTEELLQV
jgi:hypothetical protein